MWQKTVLPDDGWWHELWIKHEQSLSLILSSGCCPIRAGFVHRMGDIAKAMTSTAKFIEMGCG